MSHESIPDAAEKYHQTNREILKATGHSIDDLLKEPSVMDEELNRLEGAIAEGAHHFEETIEPMIGRCSCGGRFGVQAPVRCPSCKSTNVKRVKVLERYI